MINHYSPSAFAAMHAASLNPASARLMMRQLQHSQAFHGMPAPHAMGHHIGGHTALPSYKDALHLNIALNSAQRLGGQTMASIHPPTPRPLPSSFRPPQMPRSNNFHPN